MGFLSVHDNFIAPAYLASALPTLYLKAFMELAHPLFIINQLLFDNIFTYSPLFAESDRKKYCNKGLFFSLDVFLNTSEAHTPDYLRAKELNYPHIIDKQVFYEYMKSITNMNLALKDRDKWAAHYKSLFSSYYTIDMFSLCYPLALKTTSPRNMWISSYGFLTIGVVELPRGTSN